MDDQRLELDTMREHPQSDHELVDGLNALAASLARSDTQRSLDTAREAEKLALRIPYPLGVAHALRNRFRIHHMRGEYSEALALADDAIGRFAILGQHSEQAELLDRMAVIYGEIGDYVRSLEVLFKAHELADSCGDSFLSARCMFHMGMTHSLSGDSHQAVDGFARSVALFESLGERGYKAAALNSLCVDCARLKRYDDARRAGEEAKALFIQLNDVFGAGVAQSSLGELELGRQDFDAAAAHFEEALERLAARGADHMGPEILATRINLGRARLGQGRLEEAAETVQSVLRHADGIGLEPTIMDCSRVLSEICERQGNLAGALEYLKRYSQIRESLLNERNERQLRHLKILHETREAKREAERERQLRERDRQHFERIVSLQDEVLHHATHDIKNPLSTVSMALFLLEKEISPQNTLAHATLQRAKESVTKIRELIASVLDLAKLEAASVLYRDPIDLESSLRALMLGHELHAGGRNIDLSLSVPPGLICLCNQARLEQALNNLLSNAVKYTPDGGRVRLSAARADDHLTITVEDDGVGIPEDALPHLFKRFYRVPDSAHMASGTGIGLSIVKLLVEQHGGTVTVDSAVGRGTRFTVTLPQPPADAEIVSDSIPL